MERSLFVNAAGFAFVDLRLDIVFLGLRSKNVANPHTWGFPGGQLDRGESALDGAMRECLEELGTLPPHRVMGVIKIPKRKSVYALYVAEVEASSLNHLRIDKFETDKVGWFPLDEVPSSAHPGVRFAWPLLQSLVARQGIR
jgi:8-oxo-dGTP pyrophosphatase MutT (NUDIX family)